MKLLVCFFCLLLTSMALGQRVLKGRVLDADKNIPVPKASVFLNTTSIGTVSNDQGDFTLTIPEGKYELIISSIGYETYNQPLKAGDLPGPVLIRLNPRSGLLQAVTIEPYEKDGWQKWGAFFTDNFIGTSAMAKNCRIKNTRVLHFINSKKNNQLSAFADEPLIIENKALGYTLTYQMEKFTYDFTSHYLLYTGYAFFQPMEGKEGRQKKWTKARDEVYYGSMMHFMRSVFRNKIAEEGFEVRSLIKVPNAEKQRVRAAYSGNLHTVTSPGGGLTVSIINKDTADYYNRILKQDDYRDLIGRNILTGDSVAYAIDSITAGLNFANYLLIIYKKGTAAAEYRQQFPKSSAAMMSEMVLINQKPVEIQANGSYFDPVDVLSTGYWAWSEKMATMLPFDYHPSNQ